MTALLYLASTLIGPWGVAHPLAARCVVAGLGEISMDKGRIITMEWIVERVAVVSIAALVAVAEAIAEALRAGPLPANDGWAWLYRFFDWIAPRGSLLRKVICGYFSPSRLETAASGRFYRCLGVPQFGRIIPTGGISIRRATGARMAPYTLSGTSLGSARDFYYRACVFEALHLPFVLALAALAAHRASMGRIDYAVQETVMNIVVNVYPILHHRRTRYRILSLLRRRASRGVQNS